MPRFYIYTGDGNRCDVCQLASNQCAFIKEDGSQCKNKVVMTNPFCWIHTLKLFGVKVKPSTHVPGQNGLFAEKNFSRGDFICPYYGEIEEYNPEDINQPYAIKLGRSHVVNADCYRSIGAQANHANRSQINADLVESTADVQDRFGAPDIGVNMLRNPNGRYASIKAIKAIPKGREILVNYGRDYNLVDDHVNTPYVKNEAVARRRYCRD